MRVLFLHPGLSHNLHADLSPTIDRNRGALPPLGLLYVMGAVAQRGNHTVEFVDAALEGMTDQAVAEAVRRFRPDVAAVTVNTFTLRDALLCARILRRVAPACRIVFGGPHCYVYPRETAALPEVDYVVLGEGEETFPELLEALERDRPLAGVRGIAFEGETGPVITEARPNAPDLDKLPRPARELTPYQQYASVLGHATYMTTIMSSRGCPYSCSFCDRPIFSRQYRAASPEAVLQEIESCMDLGIREFQFYDDTFTVDRARVLRICELIGQRRHNIVWDIRTRLNLVDRELLAALRRAGCIRIRYGVEASSEETLRELAKGIDLAGVRDVFAETHRQGIETLAYFMIGSPGERRADVLQTVRFAKELRADYAVFSITSLYPHTPLYTRALAEGRVVRDVWQEYARDPFRPDFAPPYWTEHLSPAELEQLADEAYRSFYFRPAYLLKRLSKVRSLTDLGRKAKMALRLMR